MKRNLLSLGLWLLFPIGAGAADIPGVEFTTDTVKANIPIACGRREPNSFSLEVAPESLPDPAQLTMDGKVYALVPPGDARLRLDICLDTVNGAAVELKRIVYLQSSLSPLMLVTPQPNATVRGLSAAVLDHHYENLFIEVPVQKDTTLLIKGWPGRENGFVTVTKMRRGAPGSMELVAGVLNYGNSITDGRCKLLQTYGQSSFRLGTAEFYTEFCTYQGAGETTDYDFLSFLVVDKNPELSQSAQRPTLVEGEALKKALLYRHNHHNACDSFDLTLAHAEYAATTSPSAGCGRPIGNAPVRKFEDSLRGIRYRVKYGDKDWQDGEMTDCPHYIFGCNKLGARPQ